MYNIKVSTDDLRYAPIPVVKSGFGRKKFAKKNIIKLSVGSFHSIP